MFMKRYNEQFLCLTLIGLLMTLATTYAENGGGGGGVAVVDPLQPSSGSATSSSSSSLSNVVNNEDFMPFKSINKDLPDYRLALMRSSSSAEHDDLMNSIKNRLWMLRPMMQPRPLYLSRKRSCMINAGLSNNCDFRDFISASNARRIWESQASPGKRSTLTPKMIRKLSLLPKAFTTTTKFTGKPWTTSSSSSASSFDQSIIEPHSQPELISSLEDQSQNIELRPQSSSSSSSPWNERLVKRMECLSGLPGGDCENSFLGGESLGQDFLRPGGRNPGRR